MSLKQVYERFLAAPNPLHLADDASLQYVTTLTTFKQQGPIIKHLDNQQKNVVKKQNERIISQVEGSTSLAIIAETTLEFISSGGAYLPGLDTFIIDRQARLPVTHFVHFDRDNKISQIRLSWDQGDLLKQVEVIGTRGRGWPVFDGPEQIKMITSSATSAHTSNPSLSFAPRGRAASRSPSPAKKYVKDPHASLDLSEQVQEQRLNQPNAVAPRQSIRPAERDMSDLFAAGHEDYEAGPDGSPRKTSKDTVVPPKGAGQKKYQPSRLFNEGEPDPVADRQAYKTNPARYNHFDLGDYDENDSFQHRASGPQRPEDMPIRPKGATANKTTAQWGFYGVSTPPKGHAQGRSHDQKYANKQQDTQEEELDVHHHGHGARGRKDQISQIEMHQDTPIHRPAAPPKPRKDQVSQFSITDEMSPMDNRRVIARTAAAQKLYADPVFGGDDDDDEQQPLKNISNNARKDGSNLKEANGSSANNGRAHRKGLESHWGIDDEEQAPVAKPSMRAGRREVQSHWDF